MAETQQIWFEWMNENKSLYFTTQGNWRGNLFLDLQSRLWISIKLFPFFPGWAWASLLIFLCRKWVITPVSRVLWRWKETVSVAMDLVHSYQFADSVQGSLLQVSLLPESSPWEAKTRLFWGGWWWNSGLWWNEHNGWVYWGDGLMGPFTKSALFPLG